MSRMQEVFFIFFGTCIVSMMLPSAAAITPSSQSKNDWDLVTYLLNQNWVNTILTMLGVAATLGVYLLEQSKIRKDILKRACIALLHEMEENRNSLTKNTFQRIQYISQVGQKFEEVNYINALLDYDAYLSMLHSGSFLHFSPGTQSSLTILYSRIRRHNETILYISHFQDQFFLKYDIQDEQVTEKWFQAINKYDTLITKLDEEIIIFIDKAISLIEADALRKQNLTKE